MEQYIPKSALVAEIEKLKKDAELYLKHNSDDDSLYEMYKHQKAMMLDLLNKVDAFEVKEVDLEKDVRQILSLYYEGIKHYDDIIKKEREENGGSDLAIKIMDGVVDARELGIQYVIDKLKVQKGEEI